MIDDDLGLPDRGYVIGFLVGRDLRPSVFLRPDGSIGPGVFLAARYRSETLAAVAADLCSPPGQAYGAGLIEREEMVASAELSSAFRAGREAARTDIIGPSSDPDGMMADYAIRAAERRARLDTIARLRDLLRVLEAECA